MKSKDERKTIIDTLSDPGSQVPVRHRSVNWGSEEKVGAATANEHAVGGGGGGGRAYSFATVVHLSSFSQKP